MIKQPMKQARDRFFDQESLDRPLANSDWRGCVLDRDRFGGARLPEVLWSAVTSVSGAKEVNVCGYFSGAEQCLVVASPWDNFSAFMLNPHNYSPEYVVFDSSGRWAVWADEDVTTVAMDSNLAELVDERLKSCESGLLDLTLDSFSNEEILSARGSYIRGVLRNELSKE